MVALTKPDEEVTVVVMRKGEKKDLAVKIGERTRDSIASLGSKRESATKEVGWMGITVQELTDELTKEFGYEDEEGVLISDVREGSPADEKGLRRGDLIQEVENKNVKSLKDYEKAIAATEDEDSVLLRIKRGGRVWYDVIRRRRTEK